MRIAIDARKLRDFGIGTYVRASAETDDAVPRARKKLAAKNLDLIVVNTVGRPGSGFEADDNAAHILGADGTEEEFPLQTKASLARAICDRVVAALRR